MGRWGRSSRAHRFVEADFRGTRFAGHPRDLRGNNDLLCLTQPDAVREVHAAYLAAGADIISTNSFTATRIAQADYALPPSVVREVNVAAARLARAAADGRRACPARPSPLRRGIAGTHEPDRLPLARRRRPRCPQRHVGGPGGGLPRGRVGAARGRCRPAAHRDGLRHAQRESRHLRGPLGGRGAGRPGAAGDLRDDRRRFGTDALRPDRRGVLAQHPPCRPRGRRPELRPRAGAAPRASRRPGPDRRSPGVGVPERRPAERARRL